MATLIQRRLAGLPAGTYLELTYVDGQKISEVRGTISETDGEESFALLTENGEELVLTFTEVKSFKKSNPISVPDLGATSPQVQSTFGNPITSSTEARGSSNIPTEEPKLSSETVKSPIETVPVPRVIAPFFRVEVQKAHYTTKELKECFDTLQKSSRVLFASAFNSFTYGQKNHDADKSRLAAGKIAETAANELSIDPESLGFAGTALSMVDRHDEAGKMFARACKYGQAALEFYSAGEKDRAGACALQAIIDNSSSSEVNVFFTILEDSILETKDIHVLLSNWERIPNMYHGELDMLIVFLTAFVGCSLHRLQGFSSDFQ